MEYKKNKHVEKYMKTKTRDNFLPSTKRILAERVAWKCSFPGCSRITIGPKKGDNNRSLNLGEAAHITAASPDGPRYNPNITPDERKSIENGIWMCRHHATLIDSDFKIYSVNTIQEWKAIAEENIYQELIEFKEIKIKSLTLIQISNNCIFYGEWIKIENYSWSFSIDSFVIGNVAILNDICLKINENQIKDYENFVVIESQGDGREINKSATIATSDNGEKIITINVKEKSERILPKDIGSDLNLNENGDLLIENGDLAIVSGKNAGLQSIYISLGTEKGEIIMNPKAGSNFSRYYWEYKNNTKLLDSLLKIELARLITVPIYRNSNQKKKAALNFINRVINAKILNHELINNRIPISIEIEFADNTSLTNNNKVYIHNET